jgi:predicted N-acetyltransferase YhbS
MPLAALLRRCRTAFAARAASEPLSDAVSLIARENGHLLGSIQYDSPGRGRRHPADPALHRPAVMRADRFMATAARRWRLPVDAGWLKSTPGAMLTMLRYYGPFGFTAAAVIGSWNLPGLRSNVAWLPPLGQTG